jgi:hypothetical protein
MVEHPTPEQTLAAWFDRVVPGWYALVQDVFPGGESVNKTHRANCGLLVRRGLLQPERYDGLATYQRSLDVTQRYCSDR